MAHAEQKPSADLSGLVVAAGVALGVEQRSTMGHVNCADIDRWTACVDALGAASTDRLPTLAPSWLRTFGRKNEDEMLPKALADLIHTQLPASTVVDILQKTYASIPVGTEIIEALKVLDVSESQYSGMGPGVKIRRVHQYSNSAGALLAQTTVTALHFRPTPARPLWPQPMISRDNEFWWSAIDEGRLVIQRCSACGKLRHPPGPSCPVCNSLEWTGQSAQGTGRVYSYTVNHNAFADLGTPYVVALIELAEGIRMVSNIVGVDPKKIEIGLPVELFFRPSQGRERQVPLFRPVGANSAEIDPVKLVESRTLNVGAKMGAATALLAGNAELANLDAKKARSTGFFDVPVDDVVLTALFEAEVWKRTGALPKSMHISVDRPAVCDTPLTIGRREDVPGTNLEIRSGAWTHVAATVVGQV